MNPTGTAQSLGATTGLQRARMTPVATPSSADPPRAGNKPLSGAKPPADSVSISDAARLQAVNPPLAQGNNDQITPLPQGSEMSRADRILADLKSSFFTQAGEEGFNSKVDFNSDGVINAGDLGMFKEKMAGGTLGSQGQSSEPPPPPTLDSIRDAFFTQAGEDGFDASADLNGDGIVNVQDLGLYRQSMQDTGQPVQPVPEELASVGTATASTATQTTGPQLGGPAMASPIVSEGSATEQSPLAVTLPNVTGTASEAGSPAAGDPSSTRLNLLDQLREAFFSSTGDKQFNPGLDANNDGIINAGDFISIRDSV